VSSEGTSLRQAPAARGKNLVPDVIAGLTTGVAKSHETRLTQLIPNADGTVTEAPVPAELPGNAVTVLHVYGNLTFAGAETLEAQLPAARQAKRPVVILRLRDQDSIGSSFVAVLERYSQQLRSRGGKLMLAGVGAKVKGQLDRTKTTSEILGAENVFLGVPTLGASTRAAVAVARCWLEETAADATAPVARAEPAGPESETAIAG
jgi:SulP family sulfate permease